MAELTVERLREILHYDPTTGVWTWIRTVRGIHTGKRAGWINKRGYRKIWVADRPYTSGRLAFLYMTGEWPPYEVDHRDGDQANDRWENLRAATSRQNAHNRGLRSDSGTGFKGVKFAKRLKRFQARISVNGRRRSLGFFATAAEAAAAYREAARLHFGEFARF